MPCTSAAAPDFVGSLAAAGGGGSRTSAPSLWQFILATTYEIGLCPVCSAGAGQELATSEEMRAEMETLWRFHLPRLRAGVPPEQLLDRVAFSQDPPLRLERCRGCGTIYRNPREAPGALLETYGEEEPDEEAWDKLYESQRRSYRAQARRLTRVAERRGTGIEVGSYIGAFLSAARDEGWQFHGVDVSANAAEFVRRLGHSVTLGTLPDAPAHPVDAVAIWNCFDQLADPRGTLRAAHRRLSAGGILALRVPNGDFYAGLRPRLAAAPPISAAARLLLAHNNLLGFPYRHGFTPRALSRMLEQEGFRTVRIVGDALVPVADEWTRRWASAEERVVKAALRLGARMGLAAPWFEVYATR